MNIIERRLSKLNGISDREYAVLVDSKIRTRYSISAELAILRQRDVKPEEFAEYNNFVEKCKEEAKEELR